MPESSGHVLETLWEDEEFVLFRGVWNGEPFPLLAAAPSAAQPSPESLARLQHSYALRDELDPAWAARPSRLEPRGGRLTLLSEDPRRRRRLLQSPSRPRIAIFALRISPGKAGDT
jgi:hypothetical protein